MNTILLALNTEVVQVTWESGTYSTCPEDAFLDMIIIYPTDGAIWLNSEDNLLEYQDVDSMDYETGLDRLTDLDKIIQIEAK